MKEREVFLGSGMEWCEHIGTGMGQQSPRTSGIPESVDNHTGMLRPCDSGPAVPVGGGTQGCGCHQLWSGHRVALHGHLTLLPTPQDS